MEIGKGGLEKREPTLFIKTHVRGNIFLSKLINNTQQQHPVPSQSLKWLYSGSTHEFAYGGCTFLFSP